jgi:hypothetical protein
MKLFLRVVALSFCEEGSLGSLVRVKMIGWWVSIERVKAQLKLRDVENEG